MNQQPPEQRAAPTPRQPNRLPKAQAVTVTRRLKSGLIAGSIMSFGVLAALVAGHVTGATARQTNTTGAGGGTNVSAANPTPANTDDGGYFNGDSGGFGVSPNAPSQQPFSGSSVS